MANEGWWRQSHMRKAHYFRLFNVFPRSLCYQHVIATRGRFTKDVPPEADQCKTCRRLLAKEKHDD